VLRFALLWRKNGEVYKCIKKSLHTGKELPITEEDIRLLLKQEARRKKLKKSLESLRAIQGTRRHGKK
jgi:hypothetical protein